MPYCISIRLIHNVQPMPSHHSNFLIPDLYAQLGLLDENARIKGATLSISLMIQGE